MSKKQTHTHTCPGVDGVFTCIQLQVKAHNCSEDQERPDYQLQQATQPRPQLGVWTEQIESVDTLGGKLWQNGQTAQVQIQTVNVYPSVGRIPFYQFKNVSNHSVFSLVMVGVWCAKSDVRWCQHLTKILSVKQHWANRWAKLFIF